MERAAWTDERLDDLAQRVDAGFDRVDADLRDLRRDLHEEIGGLRNEMREEIGDLRRELRGEIGMLRVTLIRIGGGIIIGLVGVIAAVFAGG